VRLTPSQIEVITQTVSRLTDETSEVFLFGSRLDDRARGGDVDLLIETHNPLTLLERAQLKMELESLVDLPINVVVQARNTTPTPFQRIAHTNAVN
jgi:predicted nucleotidyltransferase